MWTLRRTLRRILRRTFRRILHLTAHWPPGTDVLHLYMNWINIRRRLISPLSHSRNNFDVFFPMQDVVDDFVEDNFLDKHTDQHDKVF